MSYSKETFKRKSKNDLYLIRWHYNLETHYVAVTNDLDKWLEVKSENTEKLKEVLGYLPKPEKAKKEDKKDGK